MAFSTFSKRMKQASVLHSRRSQCQIHMRPPSSQIALFALAQVLEQRLLCAAAASMRSATLTSSVGNRSGIKVIGSDYDAWCRGTMRVKAESPRIGDRREKRALARNRCDRFPKLRAVFQRDHRTPASAPLIPSCSSPFRKPRYSSFGMVPISEGDCAPHSTACAYVRRGVCMSAG